MKIKILLLSLVGGLLALAAWLVNAPTPTPFNPAPLVEADPADRDSEKFRETVRKGLAYLAKNQFEDGHWEGDGGAHPVAMTALVGLALLMDLGLPGHLRVDALDDANDRGAKYSAHIRKAADWLMDKSRGREGLIFSEHPTETARYMEGHGLATLFLAGVYKDKRDTERRKKLAEILDRAVKYIVKAQSSQGGWHHTSKMEGHDFDCVSATVIQIQALQAAENAGIPFPSEALDNSQNYLLAAIGKHGAAKGKPNRAGPTETAAALACRYPTKFAVGSMIRDEMGNGWLKYCETEIPMGRDMVFGRDELTQFYYAQFAFLCGSDSWAEYRAAMFEQLQLSQDKDGGWPASDGIGIGRVYAAALWCVVLQLDSKSYPPQRSYFRVL